MLTIEALEAFGADAAAGLERCVKNEAFYFRMIKLTVGDANFEKLRDAVESGDNESAFLAAHALKGSIGNLSLTPIYAPVSELTELLRGKAEMDPATGPLLDEILLQLEAARKLAD